jgi:hypothetical protein
MVPSGANPNDKMVLGMIFAGIRQKSCPELSGVLQL